MPVYKIKTERRKPYTRAHTHCTLIYIYIHTISIYLDANTAATTINNPPTISFNDETSPRIANAHIVANTDSMQSMIFDSLAEVSLCPRCWSKSATAPGPTALYANSNQTTGEFHPDHSGRRDCAHPGDGKGVPADARAEDAVTKNHPRYIRARSHVFVNCSVSSE
mmetsp:Transcript_34758/g.73287  ORF Transcript_34758/g.73287 Transcript_34758/m.73287 type:complete len:166 (+) Transcript_34758:155-652(+)